MTPSDSRSNESTKQHIKGFLLTSLVFEMTETYNSLRLSKFNVKFSNDKLVIYSKIFLGRDCIEN
jgi:hypothetical protein